MATSVKAATAPSTVNTTGTAQPDDLGLRIASVLSDAGNVADADVADIRKAYAAPNGARRSEAWFMSLVIKALRVDPGGRVTVTYVNNAGKRSTRTLTRIAGVWEGRGGEWLVLAFDSNTAALYTQQQRTLRAGGKVEGDPVSLDDCWKFFRSDRVVASSWAGVGTRYGVPWAGHPKGPRVLMYPATWRRVDHPMWVAPGATERWVSQGVWATRPAGHVLRYASPVGEAEDATDVDLPFEEGPLPASEDSVPAPKASEPEVAPEPELPDPADHQPARCRALTSRGHRCKRSSLPGGDFCRQHATLG